MTSLSVRTRSLGVVAVGLVAALAHFERDAQLSNHAAVQALPGLTYEQRDSSLAGSLIVTSVQSGGVAEFAGIASGDIITGADGVSIRSSEDLAQAVDRMAGSKITLRLQRGAGWFDTTLPRNEGKATMAGGNRTI